MHSVFTFLCLSAYSSINALPIIGDLNAPVVNKPAPVSLPVAPKPALAPASALGSLESRLDEITLNVSDLVVRDGRKTESLSRLASYGHNEIFTSTGRYRSDGKCGAINLFDDGNPAECDPNSQYWCCSEHGFCGGTHEHCSCDTCINFRPLQVEGEIRIDLRCDFPLEDGTPRGCDGSGPNPCCSLYGYCGPGDAHCACVGCVDYRSGLGLTVPLVEGTVRNDRRCGKDFKLADGNLGECDGSSPNPCCSKWGYCGPGADHCDCPACTDYRTQSKVIEDDFEGAWRKDGRCGSDFPLPGGDPAECNPNSENFCCSKWGFCGSYGEHCTCDECVNYAKKK